MNYRWGLSKNIVFRFPFKIKHLLCKYLYKQLFTNPLLQHSHHQETFGSEGLHITRGDRVGTFDGKMMIWVSFCGIQDNPSHSVLIVLDVFQILLKSQNTHNNTRTIKTETIKKRKKKIFCWDVLIILKYFKPYISSSI